MTESEQLSPASLAIDRVEVAGRLERTRQAVAVAGYDALLVLGRSFYERPGDLAYLTNHFPPFPTAPFLAGRRGTGHGALVLPASGAPVLIVDHPSVHRPLVPIDDIRPNPDVIGGVIEALRQLPTVRRLAVAGSDLLPWPAAQDLAAAFPQMTLAAEDALVRRQRAIKSVAEIALLQRAAQVAEAGLRAALVAIRPGAGERAICAAGTNACLLAGADFVRYFRVHSGPYSAWGSRWPQATDRRIAEGEIVALDAIGAVAGYAFDVNRTAVCGRPAGAQRRLLEAGLAASAATVAAVGAGVPINDVIAAGRQPIKEAGFGAFASSSTGHGIGLETVEAPMLAPGSGVLEEGMVLCVEPGIFQPGLGGCSTEQMVVVTAIGGQALTTLTGRLWSD
ncbi:MAG: M24 family metallopeptidase [Chloroflexota bacterium]